MDGTNLLNVGLGNYKCRQYKKTKQKKAYRQLYEAFNIC